MAGNVLLSAAFESSGDETAARVRGGPRYAGMRLMTSVPPIASAALQILQQSSLNQAASDKTEPSTANGILAAANGVSSAGSSATDQARKKVSEALFDQSVPDVNKLKIHLMERLGAEFGISYEDFETASAFGTAIQRLMGEMRYEAGGLARFREIERKLGLDELGISLDEFVSAIIDPDSSEGEKLDKALGEKVGELSKEAAGGENGVLAKLLEQDETGLYGR
jgi:hypothetical protein